MIQNVRFHIHISFTHVLTLGIVLDEFAVYLLHYYANTFLITLLEL